jgi:hypothetical protein
MRRLALLLGLLAPFAGPELLLSQARPGPIYSNITNFRGFAVTNGGAANLAGNTITTLLADDIHLGSAEAAVDGFMFSVFNANQVAVTARAIVRFYDSNGAGGGPGTLLTGFTFNPISYSAGNLQLFTFSPGGTLFTAPHAVFWAGITFDNNNGTTGATAAQLNFIGQGIYNPPTLGSSNDVFFATSTAGDFLTNNPAGASSASAGTPSPTSAGSSRGRLAPPPPSPPPSSWVSSAPRRRGACGWASGGRPGPLPVRRRRMAR